MDDDSPTEICVFCEMERSPDEFEDGLRCKHCAEADQERDAADEQ